MKKTLISRRAMCLLLCALMVVPMLLTACNNSVGNEGDKQAKAAQTLTISLIKEEGMTDAAIGLVEAAINEITEGKYNTHIELQMFTEAEYQDKIVAMSQELDINGAGPEGSYVSSEVIREPGKNYRVEANGDVVEVDEANRTHTVFPTINNTQLDIVLIDSVETYYKLSKGENEKSYLANLTEDLANNGKDMSKHINTTTLDHLKRLNRKLNGELYAIPNNTYYGEYSYMFVNKKYLDELNYDISMVKDLATAKDFLDDIVTKEKYKDVTPVQNFPGFEWVSYFGFDTLLTQRPAAVYDNTVAYQLTDVMASTYYTTCQEMLYNFKKAGKNYTTEAAPDFDKDFAIGFMNGDYTIPEEYADTNKDGVDDYYVVTLAKPNVDNELFESMYAVSAFTRDVSRSFEILSLLQTDETIVNLLAYGVEDVHYEKINGQVVAKNDSEYKMNYRYAGNNFLCLPNSEMSEKELKYSANDWEFAKAHNSNIVIGPYCGFSVLCASYNDYVENVLLDEGCSFVELADKSGVKVVKSDGSDYTKNKKTVIFWYTDVMLRQFEDYSKKYVDSMHNITDESLADYETFADYMKAVAMEFEDSEVYSQITGSASATNNPYSNPYSPAAQYRAFWNNVYAA